MSASGIGIPVTAYPCWSMCYYDYVNMPSRSEKSEWFIFFGS